MKAGLGQKIALEVIDDIVAISSKALERVIVGLPKGFPETVSESIAKGIKTRLGQLDRGRE